MNKWEIINAYCRIRTIDNTIPDEVLDFIKDAAIAALNNKQVANIKELPEVAQCDAVINTYVHGHGSETYKHIQERFWAAIDAINKSTLNNKQVVSDEEKFKDAVLIITRKVHDEWVKLTASTGAFGNNSIPYLSEKSIEKETENYLESALNTYSADGWKLIQSAPKDGTEIQAWYDESKIYNSGDYKGVVQVAWLNNHNGYGKGERYEWCEKNSWQDEQGGYVSYTNVTHWQPLPAPPINTNELK